MPLNKGLSLPESSLPTIVWNLPRNSATDRRLKPITKGHYGQTPENHHERPRRPNVRNPSRKAPTTKRPKPITKGPDDQTSETHHERPVRTSGWSLSLYSADRPRQPVTIWNCRNVACKHPEVQPMDEAGIPFIARYLGTSRPDLQYSSHCLPWAQLRINAFDSPNATNA